MARASYKILTISNLASAIQMFKAALSIYFASSSQLFFSKNPVLYHFFWVVQSHKAVSALSSSMKILIVLCPFFPGNRYALFLAPVNGLPFQMRFVRKLLHFRSITSRLNTQTGSPWGYYSFFKSATWESGYAGGQINGDYRLMWFKSEGMVLVMEMPGRGKSVSSFLDNRATRRRQR